MVTILGDTKNIGPWAQQYHLLGTSGVNVPRGFILDLNHNTEDSFFAQIQKDFPLVALHTSLIYSSDGHTVGLNERILALGLSPESIKNFISQGFDELEIYKNYLRFLRDYSQVIFKVNPSYFDALLDDLMEQRNLSHLHQLTLKDLKDLSQAYIEMVREEVGKEFPENGEEQLKLAVATIKTNLKNNLRGSIVIQKMLLSNDATVGFIYTRHPQNMTKEKWGIYSNIHNNFSLFTRPRERKQEESYEENAENKSLFLQVEKVEQLLKGLFKVHYFKTENDVIVTDVEKVNLKVTPELKLLSILFNEGILSQEEVISQINTKNIVDIVHPILDKSSAPEPFLKGVGVSPGGASGVVCFDEKNIRQMRGNGYSTILVVDDSHLENLEAMRLADGIIAIRGGMTSHAAVIARSLGIPCVVGIDQQTFTQGDYVSIDGLTGEVFNTRISLLPIEPMTELTTILHWSAKYSPIKVKSNADHLDDIVIAQKFHTAGIGLSRSEHMFDTQERLFLLRKLIFSTDSSQRKIVLDEICSFLKNDYIGFFHQMNKAPITMRLLDAPFHEFMPRKEKDKAELMTQMRMDEETWNQKWNQFFEHNPMLGKRGCRIGIVFPEIYEAQVDSYLSAATQASKELGDVYPEILIPFVNSAEEVIYLKNLIAVIAQKVSERYGYVTPYKIGAMIELPRACYAIESIAKEVDFCCFGLNDLTQSFWGLSRDDTDNFLTIYEAKSIYSHNPFEKIVDPYMLNLMRQAIAKAKEVNPKLKFGACGEALIDKKSLYNIIDIGIDYVSCHPYQLPMIAIHSAQYKNHAKLT